MFPRVGQRDSERLGSRPEPALAVGRKPRVLSPPMGTLGLYRARPLTTSLLTSARLEVVALPLAGLAARWLSHGGRPAATRPGSGLRPAALLARPRPRWPPRAPGPGRSRMLPWRRRAPAARAHASPEAFTGSELVRSILSTASESLASLRLGPRRRLAMPSPTSRSSPSCRAAPGALMRCQTRRTSRAPLSSSCTKRTRQSPTRRRNWSGGCLSRFTSPWPVLASLNTARRLRRTTCLFMRLRSASAEAAQTTARLTSRVSCRVPRGR